MLAAFVSSDGVLPASALDSTRTYRDAATAAAAYASLSIRAVCDAKSSFGAADGSEQVHGEEVVGLGTKAVRISGDVTTDPAANASLDIYVVLAAKHVIELQFMSVPQTEELRAVRSVLSRAGVGQ